MGLRRVAEAATRVLERDLSAPQVSVALGADPCIADALIGITGARPGNRRLRCRGETRYVFAGPGVEAVFCLRAVPESVDAILAAGEASLFDCTVRSRPRSIEK
ncbi:formylmethanofuran dehydrogenase subunit E family protein [Methanoculleus oceani]|uniref:formylmethanofuran dehydrogenase subunit E family protein n=1 Tax=Methanoculleus oceani TaxID=2184756 RepID=UPI0020336747|nr:formylmethanofuran dehydrogenase subunit E family protein [Methanoculleus sp. CWC-02]